MKIWIKSTQILGKLKILLNVSKECPINNFFAWDAFNSKDLCRKFFFGDVFWLIHQFYRDSTTHTPASHHFDILFATCNPYTSCLAVLFNSVLSFDVSWRWAGFLTRTLILLTYHCFENICTKFANSVHTEAINFVLYHQQ